jgi:PEP-CTERM motif
MLRLEGEIMNVLTAALAAATTLALASSATAATFTIEAINGPSSWQDLGNTFVASKSYDFTVIDPSTLWSAGSNVPYSRESTANGIPANGGYGQWTMFGDTFNFGELVVQNGGKYYGVGTGPMVLSGLSGDVTAGYWDSYYGDNSGTQTLSVTAVPEPASWALMLLGFFGLGAMVRGARRRQFAAVAAT